MMVDAGIMDDARSVEPGAPRQTRGIWLRVNRAASGNRTAMPSGVIVIA